MSAFFCAFMGYLIGIINPAYIIAKCKGFDIRQRGSGNAGASNAVITIGKKAGAVAAVFDIFKAYTAFEAAMVLFPTFALAGETAGVFCILGHIFPIHMNFRGGKGLACLGGVILAFNSHLFLILLTAELILALIVDYICVVPITASILFPMIYLAATKSIGGALLFSLIAAVILAKHVENLRRIRNGTEARFSFLWNKEEEIDRLQHHK